MQDLLYLVERGGGQVGGGGPSVEEDLGHLVHGDIGGLGRKQHGDDERERIAEVQGALGLRVEVVHPTADLDGPFAFGSEGFTRHGGS